MERKSEPPGPQIDGEGSIHKAGVLGAGQMGAGIAAVLVRAGISTSLVDLNPTALGSAVRRVEQIVAKGRQDEDINQSDRASLLATSTDIGLLAGCDLVIEAVLEDEARKTAMFRTLSGLLGASAIMASNTSTIPISRLAQAWPHPERFAGMHFFNPVHRMELVEVIRGERTGGDAIRRLVALARRLGKTPIVVGDGPGFLTTRVLFPYLSQAMALLLEGAAMNTIDAAAVKFGMARGPIALLDLVGLDTALGIARIMTATFPERFAVNPLLVDLVSLGRLGQKSGAGFRKSAR
ncbi:MAG: 3-hydroxyacyl-CoA dehydrogenase family protein, partial [Isosphaeraceae bacterium]